MFFHYFTYGTAVEKRILVMLSKFLSVDLKSSWGARALEHGSTLKKEAPSVKFSHVLSFDPIKYPKIGL